MSKNYEKYLKTYSGRNLKYPLSTEGLWEVLGEDPNCDFGGHHYQPRLGVYQGKLEDIIRMAVDMPSFWTWGAGGDFRLIQVKTIEDGAKAAELRKRKQALEKELREIEKELKNV